MEIEQNTPQIVAKKFWNIVRIVLYMVRKGMSKSKLMLDLQVALQIMLKRGKLAGKALSDLMLHHGSGGHSSVAARLSCRSNDVVGSFVGPREYEFSCSNSPALFPSYHASKRKRNLHKIHHEIATDMVSFQKVFEILNNHNEITAVEASPLVALPGFGRSPTVRQLRVTDSPFPLKDGSEENSQIDKDAEEFIKKFYKDLKKQRRIAALEPPSPYHIWAH